MESLESRVTRLELADENKDERIQDLDTRVIAHDQKFRQIFPVVVMYARANFWRIVTFGLALASVLMQIINKA